MTGKWKQGCDPMRGSNWRLLYLILFLTGYGLTGALIFAKLEHPQTETLRTHVATVRSRFLLDNTCITDQALEEFIVDIIDANNRGVSAVANVTSEPNWSFGQSVFFATTILTTIGYGHVTPLSEEGKVFCVVYALFGIPVTLILFTAIVERLMIVTRHLLKHLSDKLGHLCRLFYIRLLHLCIVSTVIMTIIFLLPAAIFSFLEEDWNYLDAFYYCFISMTTIGLGDYIPGDRPFQKHRVAYKLLTTCYLFTGLTLMMVMLATIYDVPQLNIGYHFYLKSDEDDPERTPINPGEQKGLKYSKQSDEKDSMKENNHDNTLSSSAGD